MHFTERQTALLKTWVIKKLEDISDADADVLADYAIALVSTEDTEEVARANCIDNLMDFLPNNAEQFVGELFAAVAIQSYDPSQPKARPAPPPAQAPKGPKHTTGKFGPVNESRKRSLPWDGDETFGLNGHASGSSGGSRPIKQTRRGGRTGLERGGKHSQGNIPPFPRQQFTQPPHMVSYPPPSQGFPPFDPNDPAAMMAMQHFMSAAFPGFPHTGPPHNGMQFRPPGSAQRCRDYDQKGFCVAGASCLYDHDNGQFIMQPQGLKDDPSNAMLNVAPATNVNPNTTSGRGQGGVSGRGRGSSSFRGGGKRSDLSMLGPNRDSGNTSIVIEQIPDDKLEEQIVRNFFSDFGTIGEITVHADRKLAIVKFDSKAAARAAYDSPKVVFDNRFVKVYWYKADRFEQEHSGPSPTKRILTEDIEMEDGEPFDDGEFAKRQEEAQRKHEEARRQREEAEKKRLEIAQKLKDMEVESKRLTASLAKKSGKTVSPASGPITQNGEQTGSESTEALRAKLARLEAEAAALGIHPESPVTNGYDSFGSMPYQGRGGFGGRGRGRGRGFYQPYRGGWNGGAPRGGAVKRLDNRPKAVAITFSNDSSYDTNDESLRQFLLFNGMETAAISQHPKNANTALVAFHQRFEGENFMAVAGAQIPHAGKVETSWYAGALPARVTAKAAFSDVNSNGYTHVRIERGGSSEAEDREMGDGGEREEQDLDRFA